jgi:hypothetical protein
LGCARFTQARSTAEAMWDKLRFRRLEVVENYLSPRVESDDMEAKGK